MIIKFLNKKNKCKKIHNQKQKNNITQKINITFVFVF